MTAKVDLEWEAFVAECQAKIAQRSRRRGPAKQTQCYRRPRG